MTSERNARRVLQGVVSSARAKNTITVDVERTYRHPRYGKYVRKRKRYMAHDAEDSARQGDRVEIVATRPLSKRKRWRLLRIIDRSDLVGGPAGLDEPDLAEVTGARSSEEDQR